MGVKEAQKQRIYGGILPQDKAVSGLDSPEPESASRSEDLMATEGGNLHKYTCSLFDFNHIFVLSDLVAMHPIIQMHIVQIRNAFHLLRPCFQVLVHPLIAV